jgi:pyruvate dehydrogenase E2 component (dihydrolipoamide acetyltransferase)
METAAMPVEITMPQQSDTMTEGTVVKWRKKEGDKVKANEVVAEIETDKAVMEMEAFDAGTLAAIVVNEGEKVPVGAVLGVIATAKEDAAEVKKKYAGARSGATASAAPKQESARAEQRQKPATKAERTSADGGSSPVKQASAVATLEAASTGEIHEPDEVGHGATREAATAVPAVPQSSGNGHRIHVSPLAKRIAADKGIDLAQVRGSGPRGRIVQRDILAFAENPQAARTPPSGKSMAAETTAPAAPARVARGQTEQIPLTKMRAAIAAALQKSKQTVPHFYVTIDVDVEELSNLRARLNKQLEAEGTKLSLNDFVSKAVCAALLRHPALNAHFGDNQITRFGDVHLGFAVSIPDGLLVPVIRSADQMGLKELQQQTADLAKKARATPPRLKEAELKGATFTISNLGMYGVKAFDAIINPPSVAILAVAGAEKRPVVKGDQIVARTIMSLTLSVDHRAVDGATAAEFLRTLKGLLEEPGMMLV